MKIRDRMQGTRGEPVDIEKRNGGYVPVQALFLRDGVKEIIILCSSVPNGGIEDGDVIIRHNPINTTKDRLVVVDHGFTRGAGDRSEATREIAEDYYLIRWTKENSSDSSLNIGMRTKDITMTTRERMDGIREESVDIEKKNGGYTLAPAWFLRDGEREIVILCNSVPNGGIEDGDVIVRHNPMNTSKDRLVVVDHGFTRGAGNMSEALHEITHDYYLIRWKKQDVAALPQQTVNIAAPDNSQTSSNRTFDVPVSTNNTTSCSTILQSHFDLAELTGIGENKANLRRLTELLESNGRNNLLPFVGAGLSKPFGFALWTEFLVAQGKYAGIEPQIKARITNSQYEEAAQDLLDARGYRAFNDAIEEAYGSHKLKGTDLKGAVTHLPRFAAGPVITTNFDPLIEMVFDKASVPFQQKVWGAKVDIATNALYKNERILLKLHGDVQDSTDRILTKTEYSKHYLKADGAGIDFSKPLPKLLHQMLVGRPLLFVGCSLNNDRTVAVLEQVATEFRSTAHYAIVECPASDDEFRTRDKFLSDHNIRPIWFPTGRYEIVEQILAFLVSKAHP